MVMFVISLGLFFSISTIIESSESVRQINRNFKNESIIRLILAVIGLLSFNFSIRFGWGFILGGAISKESINLKTKEGLILLTLIVGIMAVVLYFLLDISSVFGYILSTISYFILRAILNRYQNK